MPITRLTAILQRHYSREQLITWQNRYDRLNAFLFTWRGGLWFAFAYAAFALLFALTAQFGFGFEPCTLCLWQRIPYTLCLIVALVGLNSAQLKLWRGAFLLACAALFLIDGGIASFHIGVEQHWWSGTASCAIQTGAVTDAASLRESLLTQPVARCDEIAWTWLGLSMTVWNLFYALFGALFTSFIVFFGRPQNPPASPRRG